MMTLEEAQQKFFITNLKIRDKLREYQKLMTPVREAIINAIGECEKAEQSNKVFMHTRYALYTAIDTINTELKIKTLLAQQEAEE